MQWNAQAEKIFRDMLSHDPPEVFRESAIQVIGRETERNAQERLSETVEMEDFIRACLSETPAPFRSRMLASLTRRGVDLTPYGIE